MAAQIEIQEAGGGVRRVAMGDATVTLGSGEAATIRCTGHGIDPLHLRFVPTGRTVRVEPVAAGATVEVNGETLFCKDLEHGDVVAVGPIELRWLDPSRAPAPVRPVRPVARSAPVAAPMPRRTAARSRGAPPWMMVSGTFAVVAIAVVLVLKALSGSTWPHTPADYIDLAREQLANSQPERALATLDTALQHAEGDTRQQALTMQADIRRHLVERAEVPKIQTARTEHDLLMGFARRYPQTGTDRPASREFVRQCDEWLARHGELCRRLGEGQSLVQWVEAERARCLPAAALGEPETAADALFAAEAFLRFQYRDYRSAIARLDAFTSRTPDERVTGERARLIEEGEKWLQGKLRFVDDLLARGDRGGAERELQGLEKWSMLPEWEGMVQERRNRL